MTSNIKGMTNSLRWLGDLLALFQTEAIKIPSEYRQKVVETKKLLESDTSGIVNSILDFAINSALVDYTIETNNDNLTEILNKWLLDINIEYIGKLPNGIESLAKEYFRERWKGSSNLVLRTFWDSKDDLILPRKMFFVDGEDVVAKRKDDKKVTLGDEKYYIRIDNDKEHNILIPQGKEEMLFVQRPFDYWGTLEPIPYIIRRGLFRNLKFLELMSTKGEFIVARALEYLFLIKKGTENLAMTGRPEFVYNADDLKKVTDDFASLMEEKKNARGVPTYAANFDTEIEHVIPEYQKAISEAIYSPIERRLLAGLGIIDIVTGTASTRRESLLNPKPFISEIKQGIEDFKTLLKDILTIVKNRNSNRNKYFGGKSIKIEIHSSPVEHFIDDKLRDHIRSMYDRGTISIETYNSLVGVGYVDHKVEVNRRTIEKDNGMEDLFYPHLIDNREGVGQDVRQKKPGEEDPDKIEDNPKENIPDDKDKDKPESKNYRGSAEILEEAVIVKKKDGWHVLSEKNGKNLGGPYKTKKEAIKRLKQVEWYKNKGEVHESLDNNEPKTKNKEESDNE